MYISHPSNHPQAGDNNTNKKCPVGMIDRMDTSNVQHDDFQLPYICGEKQGNNLIAQGYLLSQSNIFVRGTKYISCQLLISVQSVERWWTAIPSSLYNKRFISRGPDCLAPCCRAQRLGQCIHAMKQDSVSYTSIVFTGS